MSGKTLVLAVTLLCCIAFSSAAFDPESVQGAWLFDENEGDEVLDSSGKEHHGSLTAGDVDWVDGKFGSALEFFGGGKVVD